MADMLNSIDTDLETDATPSLQPSPFSHSIPSDTEYDKRVTLECCAVKTLSLVDIAEETNDSEAHRAAQLNDDNSISKTTEPRNVLVKRVNETCETYDLQVELDAVNERDSDEDTCLHNAIILEKDRLATALICLMGAAMMSLDLMNQLCQTPLHLAVLTLQRTLVSMLVEYGADISIRDTHLRTPLHIATELEDIDILQRLLSGKGENAETLNLYNEHGQTCLQMACSAKYTKLQLVKILLSCGADVNLGDRKSKRTPLHFAAESGNCDLVRFLLGQSSIVIDKKTLNGETPLILAQCRKHEDVVTCLREAGANINLKTLNRYMDQGPGGPFH